MGAASGRRWLGYVGCWLLVPGGGGQSPCRCVRGVHVHCVPRASTRRKLPADAVQERIEHLRQLTTRRFTMAAVGRCWTSWRDVCLSGKKASRLLHVAGSRLARRGLTKGWLAWVEEHMERRRLQRVALRAAVRLTRPKLASFFGTWRESAHESALAAASEQARLAAEQLEAEREARVRDLQHVAATRFGQGQSATPFALA